MYVWLSFTTSRHDMAMKKALEVGCQQFLLKPDTFEGFIELAERLKSEYLLPRQI